VWVSELTTGVQLLWEDGNWGQEHFGNPKEAEHPLLEATTEKQEVKTVTDWEDLVCRIVIWEV
jgi:hypothetical protein